MHTKPGNILVVTNSLGIGGKEKQMHLLYRNLEEGKRKIFLLIRRNPIAFPGLSAIFTTHFISPAESFVKFIWYFAEILKETKPQIVHTWEATVTLSALFLKPFFKFKLINGAIRYAKHYSILSRTGLMQRMITSFSDINVSNSAAGLAAFHIEQNKKNLVIHNGIDFPEFDRQLHKKSNDSRFENTFIIGACANFTRAKDYTTLIHAGLKLLSKHDDLQFVFIGDGPEKNEMESMVPAWCKDKFLFMGQKNEPASIIKQFDIGVLLSKKEHSEGMSNSIMEYMAAAKPVLATSTGGNPDLILEGITGFLIAPEDQDALIEKLTILIENRELRERMGRAGRERIEEHFSLKRMVDAYSRLYDNLYELT